MLMMRLVFCLLCFLHQGIMSQSATTVRSMAVDPSRPYIDIVYESSGKRVPVFEGESDAGIWLRLRNNLVVPIKVHTLHRANGNPGSLLVHEVANEQGSPVMNLLGVRPAITKPLGYSAQDVLSDDEIAPAGSLLFSVPVSHVTRRWSVRVEVFLPEPTGGPGRQPRTFVEFDWAALPEKAREAADAALWGRRLPAR